MWPTGIQIRRLNPFFLLTANQKTVSGDWGGLFPLFFLLFYVRSLAPPVLFARCCHARAKFLLLPSRLELNRSAPALIFNTYKPRDPKSINLGRGVKSTLQWFHKSRTGTELQLCRCGGRKRHLFLYCTLELPKFCLMFVRPPRTFEGSLPSLTTLLKTSQICPMLWAKYR